jgi:hypothetical protein
LHGQTILYANPLHWEVLRVIAFKILKEPITEVVNPFVISKTETQINSEFLSSEDLDYIRVAGNLEKFGALDSLRIPLFNPLAGPDRHVSSLLVRLYCGIAEQKADILYTFHNEQGDVLKVRVNGVTFEHVGY